MSFPSTPLRSCEHAPTRHLPARWSPATLPLALALLLALAGTPARALDGLTLTLLAAPPIERVLALDLHATYPLARLGGRADPLQLSARADLLTDLQAAPALLAGLALSDGGESELGGLERYLAVGAGLGFAPAPLQSPYALAYGAAGARLPLSGGLGAVLEVGVGAAGGVVRPSVALGVSYRFGGAR